MQDVLVGRLLALACIAVEQRIGCLPGAYQREFPAEVVGILDAGIRAARPERRDAVRRIAGEQHATDPKVRHARAGEGVDARPFELELRVFHRRPGQQRLDPRHDVLGAFLDLGVGVPAELEVDAPDAVGLHVQQHALLRMKFGIEPEPALGGKVDLHPHIGDQETVAKDATFALLAGQPPQRRAAAVASHHMVGHEFVRAVGRVHREHRVVSALLDAGHGVLPAQVDQRQLGGTLREIALDVVLLQVDERRSRMPFVGEQVELVDLRIAEEHSAHVP